MRPKLATSWNILVQPDRWRSPGEKELSEVQAPHFIDLEYADQLGELPGIARSMFALSARTVRSIPTMPAKWLRRKWDGNHDTINHGNEVRSRSSKSISSQRAVGTF